MALSHSWPVHGYHRVEKFISGVPFFSRLFEGKRLQYWAAGACTFCCRHSGDADWINGEEADLSGFFPPVCHAVCLSSKQEALLFGQSCLQMSEDRHCGISGGTLERPLLNKKTNKKRDEKEKCQSSCEVYGAWNNIKVWYSHPIWEMWRSGWAAQGQGVIGTSRTTGACKKKTFFPRARCNARFMTAVTRHNKHHTCSITCCQYCGIVVPLLTRSCWDPGPGPAIEFGGKPSF